MLEFKYLTPKILRDAASLLGAGPGCGDGVEFTCHAVGRMGEEVEEEYSEFLFKMGWVRHPSSPFILGQSGNYEQEKQAIRFMFLELLALMLESENEAQAT